jgi:putative transposase
VDFIRKHFAISERRACEILKLPRSTHRYAPQRETYDEERLVQFLRRFVIAHPRHGYRRFWTALRREGITISLKTAYRLWSRHNVR